MDDEKTTIAQQLRSGRPVATFTSGVSMQPLLVDHETYVIIEPIKHSLKVGTLPVYLRPDGKYVIHRVVGVDEKHYYTRGDNCISVERIPKDWMLGVVVEIYRKGKKIRVTDWRYRLYVHVWNGIYPIRWAMYVVRAKVRQR